MPEPGAGSPGSGTAADDHGRLASLINSPLDLPRVFLGCHGILRGRMHAENMYVCVREGEGLRFPYFVDEVEPESPLELYPKRGLSGHILDTGEAFHLGPGGSFPGGVELVGGMPSDYLGVPLRNRAGRVSGVLAVQTYAPGTSYSDGDLAFLSFAADGLSLAIQRATLERELAAYRIAALVEETVDAEELYRRIHEVVAGVIPASARNLVFARVDESAGVFRSEYGRDEHWTGPVTSWPLEDGLSGWIYTRHGRSFIFEDGRTPLPPDARLAGGPVPAFWLGAPLVLQGRIIGMVIVQSYSPDEPITREDEFALNAICPHIATAIGRTELFSRFLLG